MQQRDQFAAQAGELDEATRLKIEQLYEQALGALDEADRQAAETARFNQAVATAAEDLAAARSGLDELGQAAADELPEGAELPLLQARLADLRAQLGDIRDAAARAEAEPMRRLARRRDIEAGVQALTLRLEELQRQLAMPPAEDVPAALTAARRKLLKAQHQAAEAEVAALRAEAAAYDATAERMIVEQDLAALSASRVEGQLRRLQQRIDRALASQAEGRRERAEQLAAQLAAESPLRPQAEQSVEYARELVALEQEIARVRERLAERSQTLERLRRDFDQMQSRVHQVGLTYANGMLMRSQQKALPSIWELRRTVGARQQTIQDVQERWLSMREERRRVRAELMQASGSSELAGLDLRHRGQLLQLQSELLGALVVGLGSYTEMLADLDDLEHQLIQQSRSYSQYINEHVLWIRSANPLQPRDAWQAAHAAAAFGDFSDWQELGEVLRSDALAHPLLWIMSAIAVLVLIAMQRPMRREIGQLGEAATRSTCCQFLPTVRALLLTLVVSLFWPGVLLLLAWRLAGSPLDHQFARALADGLFTVAILFAALEFLRQLCRNGGLAHCHFDWPDATRSYLQKGLRRLMLVLLPLMMLLHLARSLGDVEGLQALERLAFLAGCAIVAIFLHRLLRGNGPLVRDMRIRYPDKLVYRLVRFGHTLSLVVPLLLIGLAAAGYFFTAYRLASRLQATLVVVLLIATLTALVQRLLMVRRRKLAIQQARERLAALQRADGDDDGSREVVETAGMAVEEPVVDLTAMNQQTRRLLYLAITVAFCASLWFIWIDVLPALGVLRDIPIWPFNATALTLADLFLAVVVLVVTVLAVKNIPGLLELLVLPRLPLDAGARYAVISITRYTLGIVGMLLVCHALGVHWGDIQWLVAAATVGLGFGLQEIFANFISGLIVLLERPVRVGDVVTVDGVTGVVSRIRMRATTVVNWDRQEFIVPNKEFVTGRLLNWTLSNNVNRVVVTVGVAYGSDTERARDLLLKIAAEHPDVLDDPPPSAVFDEFADSTLHFTLRCFLPKLDGRLDTVHQLHTRIHQEFTAAGIEIAFPQRDLHLRTLPPAWSDAAHRRAPGELLGRHDGSDHATRG